jgi:hypothetical protein
MGQAGARENTPAAVYLTLVEEFALLISGRHMLIPHISERVLTYLALANRPVARARLAGALWPDTTRYAKQDITEAIKFLTWLYKTHQRTAAPCLQHDVDEWLASGPTTRSKVRNFFAWARKARLNASVRISSQQPYRECVLTEEQRLAWTKELLRGEPDTLAYRVAGILVLLYAQPLTKIAALPTSAVVSVDGDTRIRLGQESIPLPQLFADMVHRHLATRPNLRTAGGVAVSPWLFPGVLPGRHLTAQSITTRLRSLGINLLGARNTALQSLAAEVPPPPCRRASGL